MIISWGLLIFSLDSSRVDKKYVKCVAVMVTATFISSYA